RAARDVGVHAFHHAAAEHDNALVLVLRLFERRDDGARLGRLLEAWAEGGVARLYLPRVDQGLAVETHVAGLRAFAGEALLVRDVVVDAVEHVDAVDARRRDAGHEPRQHRRAAGHDARARLLGKVVGAEHEAREARLGILGAGG